jgi:hypothetical protein
MFSCGNKKVVYRELSIHFVYAVNEKRYIKKRRETDKRRKDRRTKVEKSQRMTKTPRFQI